MPYTEYRGFIIDSHFNIIKNGQHVFAAAWQRCDTLQCAKHTIDASLAAKSLPNIGKYRPLDLLNEDEYRELELHAEQDRIEQHYLIESEQL
jgi:hypothetical protein